MISSKLLSAIGLITSICIGRALASPPDWNALNTSVGGRLYTTTPFELPCFSTFDGQPVTADPAACASIQGNYTDGVFRVERFSAYMDVSVTVLVSSCCHLLISHTSRSGRPASLPELAVFSTGLTPLILWHTPTSIVNLEIWLHTM